MIDDDSNFDLEIGNKWHVSMRAFDKLIRLTISDNAYLPIDQ